MYKCVEKLLNRKRRIGKTIIMFKNSGKILSIF